MSKPFFPNISLYAELVPFFNDFYTLNKEKNKKFSYQYLANKLDWSAPYLNDIFKGRKRLSLNRAIEFINLLELKGAKAERFLILYLADSDPTFAISAIKHDALASTNASVKSSNQKLEKSNQCETDNDYQIMMYVYYNKGNWSAEKFIKELTVTTKPSIGFLDALIKRLVATKRLSFDSTTGLYSVPSQEHVLLHATEKNKDDEQIVNEISRISRHYARTFLDYLQKPLMGRSLFTVGTVSLDAESYLEVKDRIRALHNYMIDVSAKSQAKFDLKPDVANAKNKVWQYQFNVFSVFEDQDLQE
ncbi:MAG: hypothetical protein H7256_04090 [Bdellovibrio sp.]|nr:hypothetical protein [Bdellovibrio sp.]